MRLNEVGDTVDPLQLIIFSKKLCYIVDQWVLSEMMKFLRGVAEGMLMRLWCLFRNRLKQKYLQSNPL